MSKMGQCPVSGLILPTELIDGKQSLKKLINEVIEKAINELSHVRENYFLTIHAKFDEFDPSVFKISEPKASTKLPRFRSNTFVFFVSNRRGFHELLWMVAPKKKGEQLKVEFNTQGVSYMQAKGAMPS